ncbi:MAG: rhomboid family intramembrane serine protease [Bacteroidales bacterium]|nr:rhomboid family intramembrane serine protease [Bacteroidales bacterium]
MTLNLIIVAATVIISILAFSNGELAEKLRFNAYLIKHDMQSWRFFSYGLIHAGWMHLLINMYVLYSFGKIVEGFLYARFGMKGVLYYGLLYLGGILFSVLFDFRKHKDDIYYNAVGASGAVSAVLFAAILVYPEMKLFIFPLPFALPSWVFGILYLIYSAYMGKKGVDNIGHNAHFWGAVFGIVFIGLTAPDQLGNFFTVVFN